MKHVITFVSCVLAGSLLAAEAQFFDDFNPQGNNCRNAPHAFDVVTARPTGTVGPTGCVHF